jgi:Tol biopolymer transport system component
MSRAVRVAVLAAVLLAPLPAGQVQAQSTSISQAGGIDEGGERVLSAAPAVWFEGFVTPARVSRDGRRALAGSTGSGDLRVVDLVSGIATALAPAAFGLDAVTWATFGPGGRLVVQGSRSGEVRWVLEAPEGTQPLALPPDAVPDWSADGTRLVFYRDQAPEAGLMVRDGNMEHRIPVPGRIRAAGWAPDSAAVMVLSADSLGVSTLYRARLPAIRLEPLVRDLDAPMYGRMPPVALSPDGSRAYLALASAGASAPAERHLAVAPRGLDLYEVELATGARRVLAATPAEEFGPFVADGYLYWSVAAVELSVVVLPSAGGPARVVAQDAMLPTWRRDGRALGFTYGSWRIADWVLNWEAGVVELDADARAAGAPEPLITGYHEDFSPVWSPDGSWIAFHSHRSEGPVTHYHGAGSSDDIYLRRAGSEEEIRLTDFGLEVGPPSWAPDGQQLVLTGWLGGPGRSGAWVVTLDPRTGRTLGHRQLALPAEIGGAANATWSPVEDLIAILAPVPEGRRALWLVRPDGSPVRRLTESPLRTYGGVDWTPDGAQLVYPAIHEERMQLFRIAAIGGEPVRLSADTGNLLHPTISPDGRWIAATRIMHRRELRRMRLP